MFRELPDVLVIFREFEVMLGRFNATPARLRLSQDRLSVPPGLKPGRAEKDDDALDAKTLKAGFRIKVLRLETGHPGFPGI